MTKVRVLQWGHCLGFVWVDTVNHRSPYEGKKEAGEGEPEKDM